MRFILTTIAAGALAVSTALAVTPTGAGFIDRYGSPVTVQTTQTGFGDNQSELNALFAGGDTSQICLGISGNMEGNGNAVVILLDTRAGGDEVFGATTPDLGGTHKIRNGYGRLTFDEGFRPDVALSFDRWNGGPGNDNVYGNYVNLLTGENGYLGSAPVDGGAGGTEAGIPFALNNTNLAGVNGTGAGTLGEPALVSTGLEVCVDGGFLGLDPSLAQYRAMVYLVGGNGDYFSNQFLPGIPGIGNLAGGPVDFRQFQGNQYVSLRVTGGVIPEPGTMGLLAAAVLPLLGLRRRMR